MVLKRRDFLVVAGSSIVAGCAANGSSLVTTPSQRLIRSDRPVMVATPSKVTLSQTAFPHARPNGTRPPLKIARTAEAFQQCTQDGCAPPDGGGGTGGTDTTFTSTNSGLSATAYRAQNYVEGYDANGTLQGQLTVGGSLSATYPYQFVAPNGATASGTGPALTSIPSDTNYVYGNYVAYIDSTHDTATIVDTSTNRTYTLSYDANGNLIISTPGAPPSVVPVSLLQSEGLAYQSSGPFATAMSCRHSVLAAGVSIAIIVGGSMAIVTAGCAITAGVGCGIIGFLTYQAAVVATSNVSHSAARACGAE